MKLCLWLVFKKTRDALPGQNKHPRWCPWHWPEGSESIILEAEYVVPIGSEQ